MNSLKSPTTRWMSSQTMRIAALSATLLVPALKAERPIPPASKTGGTETTRHAGPARREASFDWRQNWSEAPQWGGRIGYIDQAGRLMVCLRFQPDTPWVVVADNVKAFQLLDWHLAVLKTDGTLWAGDGELNEPLRLIDRNVAVFQLTLTRIGALREDGIFRIHEQGFAGYSVAEHVRAFHVTWDRRVALQGEDGALWVQEGGVVQADTFQKVAEKVDSFQIERDWLAYTQDGRLMLAQGNMRQPLIFHEVARNIADFETEVDVEFGNFTSTLRVATADRDGQLLVGQGDKPSAVGLASYGGSANRVHWAGGKLAVLDPSAGIRLAHMTDGQLVDDERLPSTPNFRWNAEGAMVKRLGGVVGFHDAITASVALLPQKGTRTGTDNSQIRVNVADAPRRKAGPDLDMPFVMDAADAPLGLSSIRPDFTRRPMSVNGSRTMGTSPVSFLPAATLQMEGRGEDE